MRPADLFRQLSALGLNAEQIAGVLDIIDADAESRKAKGRDRWHKWKENQTANVSKRLPTTANVSSTLTRGEDSSSKKQILEKEERKKDSAAKPRGDLDAFKGELSSILDPARVDAIVAVRRKKGATMTAHAGSLLVSALRACPDPSTAADEMVLRNWTGIKPEWLESRHSTAPPRSTAPPPGQDFNSILDAMQGKQNAQHSGSTIETSFERRDWGSSSDIVQLHAFPARR
jgi:hypothetical protein